VYNPVDYLLYPLSTCVHGFYFRLLESFGMDWDWGNVCVYAFYGGRFTWVWVRVMVRRGYGI
jgi:hypothetical protein